MNSLKKLLISISIISFIFFLFIGLDTFPFLRGPEDWRLPYLFVNTLPKIFPSLVLIFIILYLFNRTDRLEDSRIGKYEKIFLPSLVILGFLFQISILYFSRAGIFVLLSRIIQPEANGYFTASLTIHNLSEFIGSYNNLLSFFSIHSSQHPPGAIIMFYFFNNLFGIFPFINEFINALPVTTTPIARIWSSLLPAQKTTAIFTGFLIPFLSSFMVVPLYYLLKIYVDIRAALRGVVFYLFIPSIVLFIPLPDVVYPLFTIIGFLFLAYALKKNKPIYLFLSGFVLSIGIFFSLSILSFVLMFLIFLFLSLRKEKRLLINFLKCSIYLLTGAFTPYILMYIVYDFNFIDIFNTINKTLVKTIAPRSYFTWIFYNLYDFLIFAGIPFFILLVSIFKNNFRKLKNNHLLISLIVTVLILDFSGKVKGEASRLFIPFIPFLILIVIPYLNKKYRFKTSHFLIIYLLQAIQILVVQEFWVILW